MAELPPQRKLKTHSQGASGAWVSPVMHQTPSIALGMGARGGTKLGMLGPMLEVGQYIKSCWAIRRNQSGERGTSEIVASPNSSISEALPGTLSKKLVPGEGNTRRKGPQIERIQKSLFFTSFFPFPPPRAPHFPCPGISSA